MAVETAGTAPAAALEKSGRKTAVGTVTSAKMQKTIVVSVDRKVRHPMFEKLLNRPTTLKAHDEKGEAKEGDLVELRETRPLSATKRWRLVRVVRKAQLAVVTGAAPDVDHSKEKGGHKGKKKDGTPSAPAPAKDAAKGKDKQP
jgi:small subunit ribosomal protein S17